MYIFNKVQAIWYAWKALGSFSEDALDIKTPLSNGIVY